MCMRRRERDLLDLLVRAEDEGAFGAPRAMASTGSRGWRMGLTDVEGRIRPHRPTERPMVVVATSRSPASALMSRSVDVSAIPRSTTVVPKRERNPSADCPQRLLACERSWRHASTRSPCPAPSLTMEVRSGMGAMLATSSSASRVGRSVRPPRSTWAPRAARAYAASRTSPMTPTTSGANWRCRRPAEQRYSVCGPSQNAARSRGGSEVEAKAPLVR